ncbi:hypothetical protein PSN45_003170 [Yamadazyma tenuis]|uniref:Uncharacterized protein n=1 Tax=Candida tenuis (strain ATCC 10573 / BCRC 21748 / CBS 615 / JCM 9827 / NBRC 10315 / NRRL Y-1498 / VKM Y-70) TaxID=590646 RepID=G3AZ58_CANTC|nr:uncharacterized protein CANTEDRAFT_101229 [Yamadazyma tenuis ATCC 10573]EGV66013.1 hypothetical protein CANTEDRAFT_101229 [Yamadazyma tenuis ATCC 10573]WEJ95646.1 hypothetical protein PSN45_003170 [Yamadazyma tenuis]
MRPSPVALKSLGPTLSLEEFLFRQQIKGIYRKVVRSIYKHHERDDLMKFLRYEFKIKEKHDLAYRKYLLSQGTQRINDMAMMLGLNISV